MKVFIETSNTLHILLKEDRIVPRYVGHPCCCKFLYSRKLWLIVYAWKRIQKNHRCFFLRKRKKKKPFLHLTALDQSINSKFIFQLDLLNQPVRHRVPQKIACVPSLWFYFSNLIRGLMGFGSIWYVKQIQLARHWRQHKLRFACVASASLNAPDKTGFSNVDDQISQALTDGQVLTIARGWMFLKQEEVPKNTYVSLWAVDLCLSLYFQIEFDSLMDTSLAYISPRYKTTSFLLYIRSLHIAHLLQFD